MIMYMSHLYMTVAVFQGIQETQDGYNCSHQIGKNPQEDEML